MNTKNHVNILPEVSRRSFLKGGLALTGASVLGGGALAGSALAASVSEKTGKSSKWVKSYCGSCIWANCGTEIKVVDGVAVEIRGNKEHPSNKGTLCPRGAAQLMNLYNPYRIKAPMKRTNPQKGLDVDPGWVEISWEEAMDTITEKIKEAQAKDPRKLMKMYGFAGNLHETPFVKLFTSICDTPNYSMSCGPLCEVHHAPAMFNATFVDRIDVGHCNYLIAFGRNLGGSAMFASGPGRALSDAVDRGMKVVVVDPHATPDASKGEWIPIRPGTDTAMAMAMLHVILHELNTFDVDAMKNRSNAPYLIDEQGDYVRDQVSNKPLLWDEADNKAKAYDDPTLTNPALLGEYNVNGVSAVPAFVKLRESVATSTPEWAEEISSVPAEEIRRITQELVEAACIGSTITIDGVEFPYRPVAVTTGRGSANNMQGMRFYILTNIINLVLGAIGVPGSLVCAANARYLFEDGMMREYPIAYYTTDREEKFSIPQNDYTIKQFYPLSRFPILGGTMGAILDPQKYYLDYDIEVFFPYGANPFINDADFETTVKAFQKIPFVFTLAYHMDETTMFCDIVLPECSHLERYQNRPIEETMVVGRDTIALNGLNYKEPAVDLIYNTRQYDDIILELADRLGLTPKLNAIYNSFYRLSGEFSLDPGKKYTYQEMLEIRLKGFSGDASKGVEYFREHGFLMKNKPLKECYEYYFFKGNGRLPIYNWRDFSAGKALKRSLDKFGVKVPGWDNMDEVMREYTPVPKWFDNYLTNPSDEFDMTVANWKLSPRNLGLGGQDDNVWLREIVETWEYDGLNIQINPITAAQKGLKTGDKVIVESQHGGTVEGILQVTNLIHPEVLGFPAQAGRVSQFMNPISHKGPNYNRLLTYKEGYILADNGSISVSARVKIRKAGVK
jgi:anaerobic selenocysteine-containing dehydrogenase